MTAPCVHTDKSAEALVAYFGVLRAGAVYLPLNVAYQADEVAYFLEDAAPKVATGRTVDQPWFDDVAASCGVEATYVLDADGTGSWSELVAKSDAKLRRADHRYR
ncbi:MAG: AMP-binding protein [Acidimicrobiales bacterium]